MPHVDLSRSESTTYVCPCGTLYTATIWRWIDCDAQPDRADAAARRGPMEGACPECGTVACGAPTWLRLVPSERRAQLRIAASHRTGLVQELIAHLQRVRADPVGAALWVLQPSFEFVSTHELEPARPGPSPASGATPSVALPPRRATRPRQEPAEALVDEGASLPRRGALPRAGSPSRAFDPSVAARQAMGASEVREPDPPQSQVAAGAREAGIPTLIGADAAPGRAAADGLGAFVTRVTAERGRVCVAVRVADAGLDQWEAATLEARPIHLRKYAYPLVGVRLVGKHFGQLGCVDAVIDPGAPEAADVFRALAERFAVEVRFSASGREVSRVVVGEALEPNAALCIESARGLLAREEYPPEQFEHAKAGLAANGVRVRLEASPEMVGPGAYPHIVGGAEAIRALTHLDRVSQKDSLARLLEVDGLPMREYDAIRRRVLESSLAHGLCAPRRFWRRLVASGVARDLQDYADRLADNRAAHEGEEGDLAHEQGRQAWQEIADLCDRKGLQVPASVTAALAGSSAAAAAPPMPAPVPRAWQPTAAGEIHTGEIVVESPPGPRPPSPAPSARVPTGADALLNDPSQRLRAASDILQGNAQGDVAAVLQALEAFDTDELLAIMPDLSDLGPRAVPGLLEKLTSVRREVRQAAVILLGLSMELSALEHLGDHLVREQSTVWLDVARALGGFGAAAIRVLCQILAREAAGPAQALAIDRVSRALAEIALSDADAWSAEPTAAPGRAAVEALADAADSRVSTAARAALASLKDVQASGAEIRGETPPTQETDVRGFARRAFEAIMVPEIDAEVEA